ncbi:MAG TPA: glutathione S-transferase N-terminal domain-containing protein [Gaiellaceae bacterium]|nr:glutathione S-transferase N-terminal domain-containing protein [Gaiellaceae bacterium]
MKLYDYVASANCYKVRLLLAHLGVEYERVPVDSFGDGTLTDEYARINPARTTPLLEDPPGVFLQESNAILLHLARGTRLLPDDPRRPTAGSSTSRPTSCRRWEACASG